MTDTPHAPAAASPEWTDPPRRRRFGWLKWFIPLIVIGLFFMTLVPTMCRSREPANRVKCASNLRQLGLAIKLYADEHGGTLPADWRDLVTHGAEITSDVFICASSNITDRAPGKTPAEWAAVLDANDGKYNSYRYAGRGLNTATLKEDDVLAFELAEDHQDDGLNVLYADGHVEFEKAAHDKTKRPRYDRLLADYAAGVRPLRFDTGAK